MRFVKGLSVSLAAWFVLAAAFAGCTCVINNYHYYTRPAPVFAAKAPPAPKAETQPAAPSGEHVWVAGYWEWRESEEEWFWISGSWAIPPDEGATWVGPQYEDNNGDWVYVPGGWSWSEPGGAGDEEAWTPSIPPAVLHWSGPGGGDADAPKAEAPEAAEPQPPPAVTTPLQPGFVPPKIVLPPQGKTEPPDDPYADDDGPAGGHGKHKKKKGDAPKAERPDEAGHGGAVEPEKPGADTAKPGVDADEPDARTDDDAPKHKLKKKPPKADAAADERAEPTAGPGEGARGDGDARDKVKDRGAKKAPR